MSTQILATKLFTTPPRPGAILRPRLIDRLNAGHHGRLTLVSAPAGFGKTTLVTEWINKRDYPACWYSLDEGDSDPVRFLMYFIAALQTIAPQTGSGIMDLLQSPQPPSVESLLTPLLNDITTIPHDFIFVLDDYHVLDSQEIDSALAFLIENMPPQMHLAITTREDPPFPLARLRARGELTEIRIADLRFTQSETTEFLNQGMRLGLSDEAVAMLEARTEGWIAGLQLAAISMTGHHDIDAFLQSFTGSHRFILDYLVEEVLQRQSDRVRNFLFQTSILDRLNASLCDAVTGQDDSQDILELLERSNMLIFPLDDQRQWYRYHHLFADVLQSYALQEAPDQVPIWRNQASLWYEKNGFRADAIHHAFAAQNLERAADLVERTWPEMFYGIRPTTWLDWAMKLPDDMVRVRPVLSAGYAWMLLDKGELESAEDRLRDVEKWLDATGSTNDRTQASTTGMVVVNKAEFRSLPGSTASARAYLAQAHGDLPGTIKHAQRALTLLSESDTFWRGNTTLFLGLAQWASGDLEAAYRSMTESVDNQRQANSHYFETFGTIILAEIRVAQGKLREAQGHYEQALHLVSSDIQHVDDTRPPTQDTQVIQGPVALYVGLSELYREWGDLETATQYLTFGQAVVDRVVLPGSVYRLSCAMARVEEARGDFDAALDHLHQAERLYQRNAIPDLYPIDALKVRVWLRQGRLADALDWVNQRGLSVDDDLTFLNTFVYLTFARVLLTEHQHKQNEHDLHDAVRLLDRLLHQAKDNGRTGTVIAASILQTIAHQTRGDVDSALTALNLALTLAEPEGYSQIFLDEGAAIKTLLARSLSQGANPAYVRQLLDKTHEQQADEASPVQPNQLLIEPLSKRELEVMELLANGYSNQAIADELVIAISTVKKHVNNIFGKLGVASRTQAIQHARDLNLLR